MAARQRVGLGFASCRVSNRPFCALPIPLTLKQLLSRLSDGWRPAQHWPGRQWTPSLQTRHSQGCKCTHPGGFAALQSSLQYATLQSSLQYAALQSSLQYALQDIGGGAAPQHTPLRRPRPIMFEDPPGRTLEDVLGDGMVAQLPDEVLQVHTSPLRKRLQRRPVLPYRYKMEARVSLLI